MGFYALSDTAAQVIPPASGDPRAETLRIQLGCGPTCPNYSSGSRGVLCANRVAFNIFFDCSNILEITTNGDAYTCGHGNPQVSVDIEGFVYLVV